MSVKNAKSLPKVFYGLHMNPGVAEYREPGQEPFRIMIEEKTIKNMDPSFQGRPVYVRHVDQVSLENLQDEADGYVVESFFNSADGKHWAKFIVVSDRGHEAIRSGWKLSNAYIPKSYGQGGLCQGVEYDKEVTDAEYEHLAIVPNPRYENSVILTPEQFKQYNEEKELELKRLANSSDDKKGDTSMKLSFFKKAKVENSADLETTVVVLPKSGKEMTITQLVNEADALEAAKGKEKMANDGDMVQVGEEKMSVQAVVAKLGECMKALAAMEGDKKENEEEESSEDSESETVENKEDDAAKKEVDDEQKKDKMANDAGKDKADKEAKAKAKADEEAKKKENFESRKNAPNAALSQSVRIDLSEDRVARGKKRYGSN